MAWKRTEDIGEYISDYENAAKDYSEMGPLWADIVFPDDFEALRALYGGKENRGDSSRGRNDRDERGLRR
ncbi:MAG: hypothetical protein WCS37_02550 [Chloroflexota bacterium]|nr:hypothetical protein [Chloroflexota bacterium]